MCSRCAFCCCFLAFFEASSPPAQDAGSGEYGTSENVCSALAYAGSIRFGTNFRVLSESAFEGEQSEGESKEGTVGVAGVAIAIDADSGVFLRAPPDLLNRVVTARKPVLRKSEQPKSVPPSLVEDEAKEAAEVFISSNNRVEDPSRLSLSLSNLFVCF